jgi:hypothetical protein
MPGAVRFSNGIEIQTLKRFLRLVFFVTGIAIKP